MANKNEVKSKSKKNSDKHKKSNFFLDLKAELKRVTWPSREKLKTTSCAVLFILFAFTMLIFVTDTVLKKGLHFAGLKELNSEIRSHQTNNPGDQIAQDLIDQISTLPNTDAPNE